MFFEVSFINLKYELILASNSQSRAAILKTVKIPFMQIVANIDEEKLLKLNAQSSYKMQVQNLAGAKAMEVSTRYPDSLIIGADQMVLFENRLLGKPGNQENTVTQLSKLQSKRHQLLSGWAICLGKKILAKGTDTVSLKMRPMSKELLFKYVELEKSYDSCGGYYFESAGRLLFDEVSGSYDSILGLPLEPLLNAIWDLDLVMP